VGHTSPQETYFTLDGKKDMFWARPMNMSAIATHCLERFGFAPREDWIATEFAAADGINQASNIVFSSGLYVSCAPLKNPPHPPSCIASLSSTNPKEYGTL
jgi:hypothetical protein